MTNDFGDKIKKGYDNIADVWNEKREWYIEQESIDEAIAHLQKGASILDVGCGSGKPISEYLLSKGFDVHGIDISEKQVEHAKRIIPKEKLFVTDILSFSITVTFDAIICWFTIFHIHANQHPEVLKKFHSLLKPKGILLITFADTSIEPEGTGLTIIDEHTIESEMFGERFYHSGNPAHINRQIVKSVSFKIIGDKIDQPGNQVILAMKE
jgi:2-polyprenyl-3-methyl-5-hydroxy-6-metoxy-1,4-benzoquinol methylase